MSKDAPNLRNPGTARAATDAEHPFLSVIIPVYNDPTRLRECLRALERQTYPPDRYEVVVVDNGSDLPLALVPGPFPHAQLASEPRAGVSRARATGLGLARGSLLAFTDADCIPDPDWIARGVERFQQLPRAGLVGGAIEVFARDPGHPNVAELLCCAMHFKQERFITKGGWCMLANAFSARPVIDAVGAMDPVFTSSGEVEWAQRIRAAGYAVGYAPEAIVRHPARASMQDLCWRTLRLERAWTQLRDVAGLGRGARAWLGQYVVHPVGAIARDVLRNPQLAALQKAQLATLAVFLMLVRLGGYALLRLGVRFDSREHWG